MGRRFLQGLQESIESLRGEHVHLVYDVDLVSAIHRGEIHRLAQVTDFIDATVGSRIDFKDVHGGAIADFPTRLTLTARVRRRALLAIQSPGKDLGGTGLACTPGSGEKIGMANAAGSDSVGQSTADMLLPHQILEGFRSPLAI